MVNTTSWDQFAYMQPISAALKVAFGIDFAPGDNGGGCTCLASDLMEGGVYALISAAGEPMLFTDTELADLPAQGVAVQGYAIGVYCCQDGHTRSYATDHLATTPELVVELAKRALIMAATQGSDNTYPDWARKADGTVRSGRSSRWPIQPPR